MNSKEKLDLNFKIISTSYGFKEIVPKPSVSELSEFYSNQYFDSGTYSTEYSSDEMLHKKIFFEEAEEIIKLKHGSVLDVGCGEGFSLDYFNQKGWLVKGVDFTSSGVERHFPYLINKVTVGDILTNLEQIIESNEKFDLIICNNVLEHVTEPIRLLKLLAKLCKPGTICRIQVPNDYSWLQGLIVNYGFAKEDYWVSPPGHLSYFNKDNFTDLLTKFGFNINFVMGDFPIEIFLLNKASNYKLDPSTGGEAHKARLLFDNALNKRSIKELIAFRKGCGEVGLGRNIIVYCQRN